MRSILNVTHTKLKVTENCIEHKNCKNLVSHSAYSRIQQGEEMTTLAEILQRDSLYKKSTLSLQERAYKMRQQKSNKGFTLIELLIVIAIIGILAAVLIPNLLSARKRAYDTATQSTLREVSTAAEMYYIDNNAYPATMALLEVAPYDVDTAAEFTANNLTISVTSADATTYEICGEHSASDNIYKVTPDNGIELDTVTTAC